MRAGESNYENAKLHFSGSNVRMSVRSGLKNPTRLNRGLGLHENADEALGPFVGQDDSAYRKAKDR
jgi:hypothetical protein